MARILVIDDDIQTRKLLGVALPKRGHEVRLAADGDEGIGVLERWQADVVLCDMQMPGKDGLDTVQELTARWPAIKIVATTGGPSLWDGFLADAIALGAVVALPKPFSLEDLDAALCAAGCK